jgi:hypothetical protein
MVLETSQATAAQKMVAWKVLNATIKCMSSRRVHALFKACVSRDSGNATSYRLYTKSGINSHCGDRVMHVKYIHEFCSLLDHILIYL